MTARGQYQTNNREAIVAWFAAHEGERITAQALSEALKESGHPIAQATLYRQLKHLLTEGVIHRVTDPHAKSTATAYVYQSDHSTLVLYCNYCGKTTNLQCSQMNVLYHHLEEHHQFIPDETHLVFSGCCAECDFEENKNDK